MIKQKVSVRNKHASTTKEFERWLKKAMVEEAEILDGLAESDKIYTVGLNPAVHFTSTRS